MEEVNMYIMVIRRVGLILLLLIFIETNCIAIAGDRGEAAKSKKEKYSTEEVAGLNFISGNINSITRDQEGFLWLGSWDGLFMYDGYQIRTYKPRPGFQSCFLGRKIRTIFSDSHGRLWVGSNLEGLHLFDEHNQCFVQYTHDPDEHASIPEDDVMEIWEDSSGNIWIATTNGYISKLVKKGDQRYEFHNYAHRDAEVDFLCYTYLENDIVWLGTTKGVFRFDLKNPGRKGGVGNFESVDIKISDHNLEDFVVALHAEQSQPGHKETVWVGTLLGTKKVEYTPSAKVINKKRILNNSTELNHIENRITAIYQGKSDKDHLWIGTDQGIFKLSKKSETAKPYNIPGNNNFHHKDKITAFFEDNMGVMWVGTNRGIKKIHKYRKEFGHIGFGEYSNGVSGEIKGVVKSENRAKYVATHGMGLMKIGESNFNNALKNSELINIDIPDENTGLKFLNIIGLDSQNNLWAGTDGDGLYKISLSSLRKEKAYDFKYYQEGEGNHQLSDGYIYSMLNDQNGELWIGTYQGGLNRYDEVNDQFIVYDHVNGLDNHLSAYPIVKLYEDDSGKIWIGTRGNGIYIFKPSQKEKAGSEFFKHIYADAENGLLDNFITDLYKDEANRMWIGTEAGLCYMNLNTGKFRWFTRANGFPADVVQSITGQGDQTIWVSTKKAVVKVNTELLNVKGSEHLVFQDFDYKDGIVNKFFNNNASLSTEDNILFGGLNGITFFNPREIQNNPHTPIVALTDFELNHESVKVGSSINGRTLLTQHINDTEHLTLRYKDKILTFEYAALHFAAPEKNTYAYMMDGFDDDWIYTDANRRYAHYTNLSPGDYTFKVRASNNDGLWENTSKTLKITVLPPFWLTNWAFFLYVLVLVGIFYMVRKITLARANLKHRIQLERVEREKSNELHKLELQYFTNISHEIRTPLTLILAPLEKVLNTPDLNARLYNQLLLMHHHGQRLFRLLNQLMDFRKQGMGHMKLRAAEGNFIKFVKEVFISFRESAQDRNISYDFDATVEELKVWYDRDMLEKILYNLLSNAFKYTSNEGQVRVGIAQVDIKSLKQCINKGIAKYQELYDTDYICVEVADSGQGISDPDLEHVFERFYQIDDKEKRSSVGTGIGLALTKELVILHKGVITVESQKTKGTSFKVYLPLGKAHLSKDEIIKDFKDSENLESYHFVQQPELKPVAQDMDKPTITNEDDELPNILIIEDNEDVRNYISSVLIANYKVLEAANGKEGCSLAMDEVPDLIISDVMMPEMDGIELCSKLKKDERTSHIPIILLTARTSLIFKVEGIETGADDYITKPFNPEYLEARIKNLIQQRKVLKKRYSEKIYVKPKDITINSVDEHFLQKAIEVVNNNMGDSDYGIENLCKDLGMSRMQLYRKLKALTGQSANEFVRLQRLQRAAQLLADNQLTVSQITYEVGFNDLKYFRNRFFEHFGMTPSEYARKHNSSTDLHNSDLS